MREEPTLAEQMQELQEAWHELICEVFSAIVGLFGVETEEDLIKFLQWIYILTFCVCVVLYADLVFKVFREFILS